MTVARTKQPSEAEIRAQLDRILSSSQFSNAERSKRFVRFLVEEALAGRAMRLKEYTLAVEVFDRDTSFDPAINPAIRVEASRLRRRLEHYYLTQGREDPVLIEVPRGTYVPAFSPQADVLHLHEDLERAVTTYGEGDAAKLRGYLASGPCIAVLPFENLGDPSGTVFGNGITVEIITALARFREFRVFGRHTVFQHRGTRDAVELNRELGVRYVLEGTVRRSDDRLRVHAELLSGTDGTVRWAERYERDLTAASIFDVQDEIARQVVATVAQPHGVIARPELQLAKRKPPERLDSYDCVLLFYDYTEDHSPAKHRTLRAALERQVQEEPHDSALWAALSMLHTDTWRFGFNAEGGREAAREAGLAAAQRAVDDDPLNPLAYHALFLAQYAMGARKAFRDAAERAVSLNPNNPDILADYGLHLVFSEDWTRGLLLLKMALALNPEPPDWYWFPFFLWHYDQGELEAALDVALRAHNEQFFWTHGMHALAYMAIGMRDEARGAVERLLRVYPDFARQGRAELGRWLNRERTEKVIEVLRAAGLAIE